MSAYVKWDERDEILIDYREDDIRAFSSQNGIIWPNCRLAFWCLVNYAIMRIRHGSIVPHADVIRQQIRASQYLAQNCTSTNRDMTLTYPKGILTLPPELKLGT